MPEQNLSPVESIRWLIGFDTTPFKSNLELIHSIADYLGGFGVESTLVHNDEQTKANLIARIGPAKPGGIVLPGHSDVVPLDG